MVVAENRCQTASSPVKENKVSGSMVLGEFNGPLEVPLDSLVRTALWLELQPLGKVKKGRGP